MKKVIGKMKIIHIVVFVVLVGLAGCASPAPRQCAQGWSKMQLGLSKNEVRQLLGEPQSVTAPVDIPVNVMTSTTNNQSISDDALASVAKVFVQDIFDSRYERWVYGSVDWFKPSDSSFAVYFTSDGKVVRYQRPTAGRFRNLPKEDERPGHNGSTLQGQ